MFGDRRAGSRRLVASSLTRLGVDAESGKGQGAVRRSCFVIDHERLAALKACPNDPSQATVRHCQRDTRRLSGSLRTAGSGRSGAIPGGRDVRRPKHDRPALEWGSLSVIRSPPDRRCAVRGPRPSAPRRRKWSQCVDRRPGYGPRCVAVVRQWLLWPWQAMARRPERLQRHRARRLQQRTARRRRRGRWRHRWPIRRPAARWLASRRKGPGVQHGRRRRRRCPP